MKKRTRFLSALIAAVITVSSMPFNALAENIATEQAGERALREEIRGDEKWQEQFPNGLFNFIGTQYTVSEDNKTLEISLARQGGTSGEVSIELKALDVSAEYGRDYKIYVEKTELTPDEEARPLFDMLDSGSVNISEGDDGSSYNGTLNLDDESAQKLIDEKSAEEAETTAEEAELIETTSENSEEAGSVETTPDKLTLRTAREQQLGKASDRRGWREVDSETANAIQASYDEALGAMPGANQVITFADGEYIKNIYVEITDDKISEAEEQFILFLENPEGGAERGEFNNAYVNIADNDEVEQSVFSIDERVVYAKNNIASVTVTRKGGLYQYASVYVGTEEATAIASADYAPGLEEITFAPGVSLQTVFVNISDNIYRTEERSFYIRLTEKDGSALNAEAASCEVIVPATDNAKTVEEYSREQAALSSLDNPQIISDNANDVVANSDGALIASNGAEMISRYGFSPQKGQWALVGTDFMEKHTNDVFARKGLEFSYIGGDRYAYNTSVKLFGVKHLSADYHSEGGRYYKEKRTWHCYPFWIPCYHTKYEGKFQTHLDIYGPGVNSYSASVDHSEGDSYGSYNCYFDKVSLGRERWDTQQIGYYAKANGENGNRTQINWMSLVLRDYKIEVLSPDTMKHTDYSIKNGNTEVKGEREYSPGSMSIASVVSNVGNSQNNAAQSATVYRSDLINLSVADSREGSNYAQYDGFTVTNPANGKSVRKYGASLLLDSSLFKALDMFSPDSKFVIKPIYKPLKSELKLEVKNSAHGSIAELNADSKTYTVNRGDTISGITAIARQASMSPQWSGKNLEITNVHKENGIKKSVDILLTDGTGTLTLGFGNPEFKVEANPNEYKYMITAPVYNIDGTEYDLSTQDGKDKYQKCIEAIFKEQENSADKKEHQISLSFEYKFNELYGKSEADDYGNNTEAINNAKKQFGEPNMAELRIYTSHVTGESPLKEVKKLTPQNGKFTVSGELSKLGWESGDYATVVVYGSGGKQTREIPIDFMDNTGSAVTVTMSEDGITPGGDGAHIGDINNPVSVNDANPVQPYFVQSYPAPGFETVWGKASRDLDNDADISDGEKAYVAKRLKALGYYDEQLDFDDTDIYYGNFFMDTPKYFDPTKVYYHYQKDEGRAENKIGIRVFREDATLLNPDKKEETEVSDATVIVVDKQIEYDPTQKLYTVSGDFAWRQKYMTRVVMDGYTYIAAATPGQTTQIKLNPGKVMSPKNLKVTQQENGSADSEVTLNANNNKLSLIDGKTKFSYEFERKEGVIPTDSEIIFYDLNGVKRVSYKTGAPVMSKSKDGKETIYTFKFEIDLLNAGIKPGDQIGIRAIFKDGENEKVYPEVRTGIVIQQRLTLLTVMASFDTPAQPVLKMFGKIAADYDLGYDIDLEKELEKKAFTDANKVDRELKFVNFGFERKVKKETGGDKDKNNKAGDKQDESKGFMDKLLDDAVDSAITQSKKALNDKTDSKDDRKFMKDLTKAAFGEGDSVKNIKKVFTDQMSKEAKDKKTGKGNMEMTFKISLTVILEDGRKTTEKVNDKGETVHIINEEQTGVTVFNSLVLTADAQVAAGAEVTYVTPIGIPVMASASVDANAVAAITMASDLKDPMNKKYELSGEGTVSFNPANYDFSMKFVIKPTITLSAGAGFSFLNLKISGSAAFDMYFDVPIYGDNVTAGGAGDVVFSAYLKLKVLFVQKSWRLYQSDRINMFSYGENKLVKMLSNPYNDYQYERLGGINDEDILTRDYSMSPFNTGEVSLMGVEEGEETILQKGAYPYPELKAVDLGDGRKLILFITDDTARDKYNRSMLVYTVRGADGRYSEPQAVENDGTIDESPDAVLIDNKVLITWSDAERVFTAEDNEKTMLSQMDISGAWFDIEASSISQVFDITKTTNEDKCGDREPKIAYDAATKRLMISYEKTDYYDTINQPSTIDAGEDTVTNDTDAFNEDFEAQAEAAVYGDIVNGYNLIAARFADLSSGEIHWDDDSDDGFYGQLFPDLGIEFEVKEEEMSVEIPEEWATPPSEGENQELLGDNTIIGTKQEVVSMEDPISDPRVVDMDVEYYDGQTLMAYVLDEDANLKTHTDNRLYMKLYDFDLDRFSHPIEITNTGHNSMPRFAECAGNTYLYWIKDGSIKYMNLSHVVDNHLKTVQVEIDGTAEEIDIIDKTYMRKDSFEETAVEGGEETRIGDYDIESDNDTMYIVWPQTVISYKDGNPENHDIENLNQSSQLFVSTAELNAQYEYEKKTDGYTSADFGDVITFTYPNNDMSVYPSHFTLLSEKEINGITYRPGTYEMDYDIMPDVNGCFGFVKAGDPIMLRKTADTDAAAEWSKPTRLTSDDNMSYGDVSFTVNESGKIDAYYVKYTQSLNENNVFEENLTDRQLATSVFNVITELETDGMKLAEGEEIIEGASADFEVNVKNTGMYGTRDYKYQTYTIFDGVEKAEEPIMLTSDKKEYLMGGDTARLYLSYDIPSPFVSAGVLGVRILDGDNNIIEDLTYDAHPESTIDIEANVSDKADKTADMNIVFTNKGNKDYDNMYTVTYGDRVLAEDRIKLARDETEIVNCSFSIADIPFEKATTDNDGNMLSSITFKVKAGDTEQEVLLTHFADAQTVREFNNVTEEKLTLNGNTVSSGDTVVINGNDISRVLSEKTYAKTPGEESGIGDVRTVYTSSDSSIVSVMSDGTLVPLGNGEAVISVVTVPDIAAFSAYTDGSFEKDDMLYRIPDELKRKQSFTVSINNFNPTPTKKPTHGGGGWASTKAKPTPKPTPTPEETAAPQPQPEINPFTDISENIWFYDDVMFAYENNIMTGVSPEEFAPYMPITRGMIVTVLGRMDDTEGYAPETEFTDVDDGAYYAPYVAWAQDKDIINGFGDGTYRPNEPVTREQTAKILKKYNEYKGGEAAAEDISYIDKDVISAWALDGVKYCAAAGIMQGREDNSFDPLANITRAEFAAIAHRIN